MTLTRTNELVYMLNTYWKYHTPDGHMPPVFSVRAVRCGSRCNYEIVSNMVNGLPPRKHRHVL